MDKDKKNQKSLFVRKGIEQPSYLNPDALNKIKSKRAKRFTLDEYVDGIKNGNKVILSRAITLIESQRETDQQLAQEILDACLSFNPSEKSLRIGITGVPGVGKSTFIESFGNYCLTKGKKVAVLAVDPSSKKSGGSILGDKTRMSALSSQEKAFIRPSPAAGTLGGVAQKTRESIILCEAAGYNTIFIETVGVGQSETAVHSMSDLFLMLVISGAGDELQGIKRGIMEMVDLIVINKADDVPAQKIDFTRQMLLNALHLMPLPESDQEVQVLPCSSLRLDGIAKVWETLNYLHEQNIKSGYFKTKREKQSLYWMQESLEQKLNQAFYHNSAVTDKIDLFKNLVLQNKISPFKAAEELITIWKNSLK